MKVIFHVIAKRPRLGTCLTRDKLAESSCTPLWTCAFPPPTYQRENFKQSADFLWNRSMWAYRLFSVSALSRYLPTKHTGNLCVTVQLQSLLRSFCRMPRKPASNTAQLLICALWTMASCALVYKWGGGRERKRKENRPQRQTNNRK